MLLTGYKRGSSGGIVVPVLSVSRKTLAFFAMMALMLTGCETINGLGNRFADFKFPDFWTSPQTSDALATGCPEAEVIQELRNLTEFAPMAPATPDNMVSSVRIANLKTVCRSVDSTSVTLDIALTLTGSLGPRARIKPTDKPSFAYPYFVALTTDDGKIVAKEIHAVSLSYDKGQDRLTLEETLRHTLPIRLSGGHITPYRLLVGFQLSDDQLAYNRANPEPKIDLKEIAMTVAPAQKQPDATTKTLNDIAPAAGPSATTPGKTALPRENVKPARSHHSKNTKSATTPKQ